MALIPSISLARWLLILVLLACIYFFHGFLVPVLAALIIGFASWPIYRRVRYAIGGSRTLAASLMLVVIVVFILTPIMMALAYALREVRELIVWVVQTNAMGAEAPE